MSMASLSASLLARKGQASPTVRQSESVHGPFSQERVKEMFPPKRPQLVTQAARKALVPGTRGQSPKAHTGKRARKTLRLDREKNRQLRLLAAHLGVSQQSLMAKAVSALLKEETGQVGCICGAKKPGA